MTVDKNDKIGGWTKRVQDHVKGFPKKLWKWRRSGAVVVCLAIVAAAVWWWQDLWAWWQCRWAWMGDGSDEKISNGETLRNLALIVGLVFGIPLALWRNIVATRQVETSEQNLRNERYQTGANMLGNDTLATRLGGIYALEHLAKDHPDEYHIQIMKLLCAFVRHPRTDESSNVGVSIRQGVEAAVQAIEARGEYGKKLESDEKRHLGLYGVNLKGASLRSIDLTGAKLEYANLTGARMLYTNLTSARMWYTNLTGANMHRATLTGADMRYANLTGADMYGATLTGADMRYANLTDARMYRTNLTGARMWFTNLTGADMSNVDISGAWLDQVKGLTQKSLNMACALKDSPPNISESTCAETDEPLTWTGGAGEPQTWLDDLDEPLT